MSIAELTQVCQEDFHLNLCHPVANAALPNCMFLNLNMTSQPHLNAPTPSSPLSSPSSMSVSRLEPELQEKIRASHPGVERVFFNKGL